MNNKQRRLNIKYFLDAEGFCSIEEVCTEDPNDSTFEIDNTEKIRENSYWLRKKLNLKPGNPLEACHITGLRLLMNLYNNWRVKKTTLDAIFFIANDYINIHSCTKEQNRKVDSRIESGLIKKLKTFSITGVVPVFKEEEQELMRKAKHLLEMIQEKTHNTSYSTVSILALFFELGF